MTIDAHPVPGLVTMVPRATPHLALHRVQVAVDRLGIGHHAIVDRLDHRAERGDRRPQGVGDGGDQVAAGLLQLAPHHVGLVEVGRHRVECPAQLGELVAALSLHPRELLLPVLIGAALASGIARKARRSGAAGASAATNSISAVSSNGGT